MMNPGDVRIIGLGNPLRRDDGVGSAVIQELARGLLPPGVEALDGGTGGLTLLHLMEGADRVILVDAAEMGLPPGHRRRVDLRGENAPRAADISVHQAGLAEVVALGRQLGRLPATLELHAIQPESTAFGEGLTPAVAAAAATLVAELRAELDLLQG